MITRKQFAEHFAAFQGIAENPEYGGDVVDWLWDWLIQQGSTGPATGPHIHWLQLDKRPESEGKDFLRGPTQGKHISIWETLLKRLRDGRVFMEYHHQHLPYSILEALLEEKVDAANRTR